jgi:WhiB family transcriptional regulator, redox-sensing transcriptional regulator
MTDWRHRAACRDVDPELFFPAADPGKPLGAKQLALPKAVCRRCPVKADCLAWALVTGQDAGVWGGLCAEERRELKRRHDVRKSPDQPKQDGEAAL